MSHSVRVHQPIPDFVCPECKGQLVHRENALECPSCKTSYAISQGIPVFDEYHGFYEGRFGSVHLEPSSHPHPFRRLMYHKFGWDYYTVRRRFFQRHLQSPGRLLDIGCAGGSEWLRKVGPVAGVDLSYPGLQTAVGNAGYDRVAQASIGHLPFPDKSFEYVVTADVIGHLDDSTTNDLLDDAARLLGPTGISLHSIETIGSVRQWAKRLDKDLYRRHLVDSFGHIGMETAGEVLHRFRDRGWEIVDVVRSLHFTLGDFVYVFDNDYCQHSTSLRVATRTARQLDARVSTRFLGNQALRILEAVHRRLTPLDSADVILLAATRPGRE